MKYCKDCEYFEPSNWCNHPNNGVSSVTGKAKPTFATTCRQEGIKNPINAGSYCGQNAQWFELKVVKPLPWWRRWF